MKNNAKIVVLTRTKALENVAEQHQTPNIETKFKGNGYRMTNDNNPKILKTAHIFRMTDDTGMLQQAIYGIPNRSTGYSSDDNARALIMAVKYYGGHRVTNVESLITKYLSFLYHAQNPDGTFRNFMSYNREFSQEKSSEDCFGRCLWALCYTYSDPAVSKNVKNTAWAMIEKAIPNCRNLSSPRASAYVIIGLKYLDQEKTNKYIIELANILTDHYAHYNDGDWNWFEDSLTYCSAVLPRAMLVAYGVTKIDRYRQVGFESLKFLESMTFRKGYFKPIGSKGVLNKGDKPAEFDEKPVEACETMLAFLEAYSSSGNKYYFEQAKTCYFWYRGKNSKGLSLIDAETGGCYDGITPDGLNLNQGAESIVSFWIAYLEIKKHDKIENQ